MDKQNKRDFIKIYKTLLWLSLFFLLGVLIRIYKLGDHNLWFDEFKSLKIARDFGRMEQDFNPPLYYILLSIWVKCFGSSEFALRSLSMIFGTLSISLIYKLGKLFFDTRTGLASAFILSISPIHIWYSQEARGYSLSTFLIILIVYIFILAIKKNRAYLWTGFIMSSILALYTNYFSFFIIILVGIIFVFKSYRPLFKPYLASLCLIFFTFLPFLLMLFRQITRVRDIFWIPKPYLRSIVITFENFNVGYNATTGIYLFSFIIFSLLFLLGFLFWWKEKRQELISLVSFISIPIIVTFLISKKTPIYLDRQMMLFSPFYYIIIAAGLAKIKMRIIKIAAYLSILVPMLFCLNNYFSYYMPLLLSHHIGVYVKKPVKPAADYINRGFKDSDLVAYSDFSVPSIFYYMPNISRERVAYFFIESEFKNGRFQYKRLKEYLEFQLQRKVSPNVVNLEGKSSIPGVKDIKQFNFERVWLIFSSWERDGKLYEYAKAVREFMQKNYVLLETKEFDGIFVDLYGCKIN